MYPVYVTYQVCVCVFINKISILYVHPTQAVYVQGYARIRKCLQFHDPCGRGQIFTEVIFDVIL